MKIVELFKDAGTRRLIIGGILAGIGTAMAVDGSWLCGHNIGSGEGIYYSMAGAYRDNQTVADYAERCMNYLTRPGGKFTKEEVLKDGDAVLNCMKEYINK